MVPNVGENEMSIKAFVLSLAALAAIAFAPLALSSAVVAQPSQTCFTKALNGDVIDPPMCFTPTAHNGSGAISCQPGFAPARDAAGITYCAEVAALAVPDSMPLFSTAFIALGLAIVGAGGIGGTMRRPESGGEGGGAAGGEPDPAPQEDGDESNEGDAEETIGDPPAAGADE